MKLRTELKEIRKWRRDGMHQLTLYANDALLCSCDMSLDDLENFELELTNAIKIIQLYRMQFDE